MLTKLNNVCVLPDTVEEFIELQELIIYLGGGWIGSGRKVIRTLPLQEDRAIGLSVEDNVLSLDSMYFIRKAVALNYNCKIVPITNVLLLLKTLVNLKENS